MSLASHGAAPMPSEYFEWKLVRSFGWTLDEVRDMSVQDFNNYLQIVDAESKAGV